MTVISVTAISAVAVVAMSVVTMPVISMAVIRMTPAPAIPGSNADKEPAYKPARPVIAIRSTGIRIIGVITPGTVWRPVVHRSVNDSRTNADADSDLGVDSYCKRQSQKHCYSYDS